MRTLLLALLSGVLAPAAISQGCPQLQEVVGFGVTTFTTASGVPTSPGCSFGFDFVGFRWTAPWSGSFYVADCGTPNDTVLGVRVPCDSTGSLLCGDDWCGLNVEGVWTVAAGTTIGIHIGTWWQMDPIQAGRLTILPAPTVGTSFCSGHGSSTPCPCGNAGSLLRGCANSLDAHGAGLYAGGEPRITADTLVLAGSGMPNGSALFFQGDTRVAGGTGAVFGDGLRCVTGQVVRLDVASVTGTIARTPAVGGTRISVLGGVSAGDVRHYQAWYRDASAYCTTATFNLTNGVTIAWQH